MPKPSRRFSLAELMLIVLLVAAILGVVLPAQGRPDFSAVLPLVLAIFLVWTPLWMSASAHRRTRTCQDCGVAFVGSDNSKKPATCPSCRARAVYPAQAAKAQSAAWRNLAILGVVVFLLGGVSLGAPASFRFGVSYLVAFPLAGGAALVTVVGYLFVFLFWMQARRWLWRGEANMLARARAVAGVPGHVTRGDELVVWWSEPPDPSPSLEVIWAATKDRFVSRVGPVEVRQSVLLICFARRNQLGAFIRGQVPNLWAFDGLYLGRPEDVLLWSTDRSLSRITQPERSLAWIFALAFLDRWKGPTLVPWLQWGLGGMLSSQGDDDLARLNRKVLSALDRGLALPLVELFATTSRQLVGLVSGWHDHAKAARFHAFSAQSWSFVEYLAGTSATPARRDAFRSFIKEVDRPRDLGRQVQRHFGIDVATLDQDWRAWVQAQGLGEYAPPPPAVARAVREHVVPLVLDHDAKIMDRVWTIREMGGAGHVIGADALIELLRSGDDVLRPEVVTALEWISGQTWGDDIDRWTAWWRELPPEAIGATTSVTG